MQDCLSNELCKCLAFLLTGVFATIIYDILRLLRKVVPHNFVAMSVEDLLFWIFFDFIFLNLIFKWNQGELRLYFLLGSLAGYGIYWKIRVNLLKKIVRKLRIKGREKRGDMVEEKGRNK